MTAATRNQTYPTRFDGPEISENAVEKAKR
jgi:hypothetical protein